MDEIKTVETKEVVEETAKKGFFTKVKDGVKKHGKKIVTGVAIVGGVLAAYALGKRSNDSVEYIIETSEDETDTDYEVVENAE